MKKLKGVQLVVIIVVLIILLTGCSESPKRITDWAQNLKAEDITDAVAWTSNFGGNYESNEVQLNDDEIQEVVTIINSLKRSDFKLNKHNAGSTPQYGLKLSVGNTDYSFINDGFEMMFEGNQWWINCEELRLLIAEKSGWSPAPVWDGTVTGTDIKTPIGTEPTSGSNINTPDLDDDNTESGFEYSERIPVVGMLTGKVDDIVSVTIEHIDDGKTCQLENPQSHEIITILSTMDAEEVPHPHHLEVPGTGDLFSITIEYGSSDADTIYLMESSWYCYRLLDTLGNSGDRGFVIGINTELPSMLEEIINR